MHKRVIFAASLLVLATTVATSPAWSAWGCYAKSPDGNWGDSWNAVSEARAQEIAIGDCTRDQAVATWPPPSPMTVRCGPQVGTKCP